MQEVGHAPLGIGDEQDTDDKAGDRRSIIVNLPSSCHDNPIGKNFAVGRNG